MIGVIIAMQSEADILLKQMQITKTETISQKNVFIGQAFEKDDPARETGADEPVCSEYGSRYRS